MQSWAEKRQMEFNPDKCEVIHFGWTNLNMDYRVKDKVLKTVEEQRDLGVHIHRSLKVATQVDRAVKKAYSVLVFIMWRCRRWTGVNTVRVLTTPD